VQADGAKVSEQKAGFCGDRRRAFRGTELFDDVNLISYLAARNADCRYFFGDLIVAALFPSADPIVEIEAQPG
jgi:hypothetical protein